MSNLIIKLKRVSVNIFWGLYGRLDYSCQGSHILIVLTWCKKHLDHAPYSTVNIP